MGPSCENAASWWRFYKKAPLKVGVFLRMDSGGFFGDLTVKMPPKGSIFIGRVQNLSSFKVLRPIYYLYYSFPCVRVLDLA